MVRFSQRMKGSVGIEPSGAGDLSCRAPFPLPPCGAGESHMEETCAAEAVPNCMRQTGTIAVRVSIPVCSQSDSKAWRRQPNAACRQVSDPTLDFPNAIALPFSGGGLGWGANLERPGPAHVGYDSRLRRE